MDAGAEAHVDPQVDGHPSSAAEESGSNQNSGGRSEPSPLNQEEILRTLATVEKDSQAIAVSFSSLFVSLRSTLSEATSSSVDHMSSFGDVAKFPIYLDKYIICHLPCIFRHVRETGHSNMYVWWRVSNREKRSTDLTGKRDIAICMSDGFKYHTFLRKMAEKLVLFFMQLVLQRPSMENKVEHVEAETSNLMLLNRLQRNMQGQDNSWAWRGYVWGMNGRMGGRGFGMERKTPPPGHICHHCSVSNMICSHDVTRVKPPIGIPKSMLVATPDGSHSFPSVAVAVLKPNEDAFEKEMEGLPSATHTLGELPPGLKWSLCKEVMEDAALTSICSFQSFCDKCKDHTIAKSRCVCGATDSSLLNYHRRNVDLESAPCPPPKGRFLTPSAASKGEKKPAHSDNNDAPTVKLPTKVVEITSDPRTAEEDKVEMPADPYESTQGTVTDLL
ncbi:hypothetical protein Bca52824_022556 [Brassica carinata]|uniref:Uncharacterized protein n=1 Tax=Brassica carinata TaxID=52824 RepID=A0A8X7VGZ1_BRACI|nr:hypothetical protein Bca52824_022556 [Brassica carinata]